MCHLTWQDPQWDRVSNRKHRKSNKKNWERSITTALTGEKDETAQFDPNLTDEQLESMQLACVRTKDDEVEGRGTLIKDQCHKRTFFRIMGAIIGASSGEKTSILFVEYVNSGKVHGRPITQKELDDKL